MSGGSWDYAYARLSDVVSRLRMDPCPKRRLLGERLAVMVPALRAIEWHDSGDTGPADERIAVDHALTLLGTPMGLGAVLGRQLREMAVELEASDG